MLSVLLNVLKYFFNIKIVWSICRGFFFNIFIFKNYKYDLNFQLLNCSTELCLVSTELFPLALFRVTIQTSTGVMQGVNSSPFPLTKNKNCKHLFKIVLIRRRRRRRRRKTTIKCYDCE